jgi:hypothetical protein
VGLHNNGDAAVEALVVCLCPSFNIIQIEEYVVDTGPLGFLEGTGDVIGGFFGVWTVGTRWRPIAHPVGLPP